MRIEFLVRTMHPLNGLRIRCAPDTLSSGSNYVPAPVKFPRAGLAARGSPSTVEELVTGRQRNDSLAMLV
jgi:hypothetical protein